jgi:hypothetical protein
VSVFGKLLTRRHRMFRDADPAAWDLLITTAERAGMYMETVPPRHYFALRSSHAFVWLPGDSRQFFTETAGRFSPSFLIHEVMHLLGYAFAGHDVARKPQCILFFENLACNIDVCGSTLWRAEG